MSLSTKHYHTVLTANKSRSRLTTLDQHGIATHLDKAAKSTLGLPALRLNTGSISVRGVELPVVAPPVPFASAAAAAAAAWATEAALVAHSQET